MIPSSAMTPTMLPVQAVAPAAPATSPRDGDRSAFGRELQRATSDSSAGAGEDRADEATTRNAAESDADPRAPGAGPSSHSRTERAFARRGDHGARAAAHPAAPALATAHDADQRTTPVPTRADDEASGAEDRPAATATDPSGWVAPHTGQVPPTRFGTAGAPADEDAAVGSLAGAAAANARAVAAASDRDPEGMPPEARSATHRPPKGHGLQPPDTGATSMQMPMASARAYEARAASEGLAVAAEAIGAAAARRAAVQPEAQPVASPLPLASPGGTSDVAATAAPAAGAAIDDTLLPELHTREFALALGARLAVYARDGVEQARLNIHPAEMGPIAVRLALEGLQVRVDLVADFAATRQVLEQALPSLASALSEAGFTLSGGGVFQHAREGRTPDGAGTARSASAAADAGQPQAEEGRPTLVTHPVRLDGLIDLYA